MYTERSLTNVFTFWKSIKSNQASDAKPTFRELVNVVISVDRILQFYHQMRDKKEKQKLKKDMDNSKSPEHFCSQISRFAKQATRLLKLYKYP